MAADERALTDFVLKAGGDLSVRMEAGKVTAHYRGQAVTVKGLTLTGGGDGWSLTLDADPAAGEPAATEAEAYTLEGQGQGGQPAEAQPAPAGPTAETAAPQRPMRGRNR